MSVLHKYIVTATVSLSISLLVTGCNDSKLSQCQRLTKAINQGTALIEKNKGQQVTTSLKLSKDLEDVTKSIRELNLKDVELTKYQTSFVNVFQTFSQQIAKAAKALGAAKVAQATPDGREKIQKARAEIDTALTAAKTAAKQADELASDVNKHCSQPE